MIWQQSAGTARISDSFSVNVRKNERHGVKSPAFAFSEMAAYTTCTERVASQKHFHTAYTHNCNHGVRSFLLANFTVKNVSWYDI